MFFFFFLSESLSNVKDKFSPKKKKNVKTIYFIICSRLRLFLYPFTKKKERKRLCLYRSCIIFFFAYILSCVGELDLDVFNWKCKKI